MRRAARAAVPPLLLGALALAACPGPGEAQEPTPPRAEGPAGPWVGAVDSASASLWLHPGSEAPLVLRYGPADAPPGSWERVPLQADARGDARCRLEGLEAGRAYRYRIGPPDEEGPEEWQGGFQTAPPEAAPGALRLAVASCMHAGIQPEQPSWDLLRAARPQLLLLLGDNTYADSADPAVLRACHLRQRRVTSFAQVVREVPTVAVWDDHDFGPNDSDGTLAGKERSLATFRELFPNPEFGLPGAPGVFFRLTWGQVELFALDVRYERSPNAAPDGPEKRMLGAAQLAWLEEGLRRSRATFKLVASGSVLFDPGKRDSWAAFPSDRARLYRALAEAGGGVVFLSGDLHRCLLREHPPQETGLGYPLLEVVSSGIAQGDERGFAVLELETAASPPTLRVRLLRGDGSISAERVVTRDQLAPR